jgi:hypothetical protein
MSDTVRSLLIFLLVPSPLYIPIAVTLVGVIADWRKAIGTRRRFTAATAHPVFADAEPQLVPDSRYPSAISPRPHLDPQPTESDTEAA